MALIIKNATIRSIIQKSKGFRWELIVVSGPADHSRSIEFLWEMHGKIRMATTPVVIGGDFNLLVGGQGQE